jgi:hypothetical protein
MGRAVNPYFRVGPCAPAVRLSGVAVGERMSGGQPPALARGRRRGPRAWVPWAWVAVAAVVAGVALGSAVAYRIWIHRDARARLEAIRQAGLPLSAAALDRWYAAVPDAENVAPLYLGAAEQLAPKGFGSSGPPWAALRLPRALDAFTPELWADLESAVQTNALALRLLHSVGGRGRARYPVDLSRGFDAELPHLRQLKRLGFLLQMEALVRARANQPPEAASALACLLQLGRSLDTEPALISQLVANAGDFMACRGLEGVLNQIPLPEEALVGLGQAFRDAEVTNRLALGLVGDRAMTVELIQLLQRDPQRFPGLREEAEDGEKETTPRWQPGLVWQAVGYFERDLAFYLRAMETNLAVARTEPPESLRAVPGLERLGSDARRGYYVFSAMVLPAFAKLPQKDAQHRAELRLAFTALAVERWRSRHEGAPPPNLTALVPAWLPDVPSDPFDGRPLRYRPLARGYVVYSIGPDGVDDGGAPKPDRGGRTNLWDMTFTVAP